MTFSVCLPVVECPVREEVEVSPDLMALPSRPVPGASNDDDDLPNLVRRWDDEPKSEDQITDEAREEASDDDTGPAMGEDTN